MSKETEEIIKKRYYEIRNSLKLPPVDYEAFLKKVNRLSEAKTKISTGEIEKRDLVGLYLALGAAEGNQEYIGYIHKEYSETLFATARSYFSRGEPWAEEVVQEIFKSTNWDSYRGTGPLLGWLRKVTANRSLDILRREKGRSLSIDGEIAVDDKDPELMLAIEECRDRLLSSVRTAFKSIGIEANNILTFTYVEGIKVRNLAKAYGTSPSTMSRRIQSAREELGEAIMKYAIYDLEMTKEDIEYCLNLIFEMGLTK